MKSTVTSSGVWWQVRAGRDWLLQVLHLHFGDIVLWRFMYFCVPFRLMCSIIPFSLECEWREYVKHGCEERGPEPWAAYTADHSPLALTLK